MKRLVINADDLGMSEEVNRQIEKCINLGVITSSTLLANAPAFKEGVLIAKKYPNISVGVHLNIIEFAPITNQEIFQKHRMLDDDGNFIDGGVFVATMDDELKRAIFEEWDAQITKIEKAGLVPSHCDSHQHTHTIPALQDVLCRVLDKHRINRVRRKIVPSVRLMLRGKKQPTVHLDKSKTVRRKKHNIIYRRLHIFVAKFKSWKWNSKMRQKYTMTKEFYSFRDFYSFHDTLHLGSKASVIELMCHPGNEPFLKETETLMNAGGWMNTKFKLVNYKQI